MPKMNTKKKGGKVLPRVILFAKIIQIFTKIDSSRFVKMRHSFHYRLKNTSNSIYITCRFCIFVVVNREIFVNFAIDSCCDLLPCKRMGRQQFNHQVEWRESDLRWRNYIRIFNSVGSHLSTMEFHKSILNTKWSNDKMLSR